MKNALLLFLTLFASICIYAQQTVFLDEGFSSVPPSGWTIDAQSTNWSSVASANAGGTSPEVQFFYSPTFTSTSRLISPQINTTGLTSIFLSFKHAFSGVYGNYTLGVATRNGTSGTWNTVWSIVNPTDGLTATDVSVTLNNADVGSSTFQICFFFSGYSYNIDYWWIDNVLLFEPCATDGKMASCTVDSYISSGNVSITGNVVNYGTGNITSMILKYQIDNGTVNSTSVTSVNLSIGQSYNYTCTPVWNATQGNYTLKVWVDDINGAGSDCNQINDTIIKPISVATQATTRLPLYEEFTSSTCDPCASFNSSTFSPFITAHPDEFSLIKYQMDWPGNGDPYYTAEGGTRRALYGVNAVPDLFIDGAGSAMTSVGMATELSVEIAKETFFTITQNPTYDGTTVTVPLSITPYVTGSFHVYVVIIEKTTTGNVSTNGETSFKHVMMKMLPNGSGTSVSFTADANYSNSFVQDLSSTNVEEMSDLQSVIFIQDNNTREVFQSSFSDITTTGLDENGILSVFSVYPNPVSSSATIAFSLTQDVKASFDIYNVLGEKVSSVEETTYNAGNHTLNINIETLEQGVYYLNYVCDGKSNTKKLTVVK